MEGSLEGDWRQRTVDQQRRGVPKERGETYYYSDGISGQYSYWLKHNPGCKHSMRVHKVFSPGVVDDDYDSVLKMNIGSEKEAYRLYRALEAYFNDVRTPPWFLADYTGVDDAQQ